VTSPTFEKSTDTSLATRATKIVVDFVELLRGRTTGPLLLIARVIVYGIVLCVAAIWSTHLLLGTLFAAAGGLLWSKRLA